MLSSLLSISLDESHHIEEVMSFCCCVALSMYCAIFTSTKKWKHISQHNKHQETVRLVCFPWNKC